ncbi:MAG: right-handed parallel beta-helix repeat-containing protein, partial [Luteimonas sp.]
MFRYALLMLSLLIVAPAHASDFYVDPVNGSNAGNGSAANPWKTLQAVVEANLIETRDWSALPYQAGRTLVTVHPGAPVKAGDTLWLRSGYHGMLHIRGAYNTATITIAAVPGQTPRLSGVLIEAAQHWALRGVSISPSYAPPLQRTTIVSVQDHNFFGPAFDIDIDDCDIFSITDASAWTANQWVNLASDGVDVGADRVSIRDSRVRNVRFGIGVGGKDARIQRNLIDGFSADGMRGLGDGGLFEYNRVQNNLIKDPPDANHDDGFQSWSVGPTGVGSGEVRGVTLRGNVFINATNPNNPLRSTMQGIGCFDGFFVDWVVENNVVVTDHWHGISFYGMRDSRIVNNTVI